MLPIDILISEHTLILRLVNLIRKEVEQIAKTQTVKLNTITQSIIFFRAYADKYHHGKEEGILFKELSQKKLSDADKKMMTKLVMEHALARKTVKSLDIAIESYANGKNEAIHDILQLLNTLIDLYPRHIEKEDKEFFNKSMQYFTQSEIVDMTKRSMFFDQNFTNKYYEQSIKKLEIQ